MRIPNILMILLTYFTFSAHASEHCSVNFTPSVSSIDATVLVKAYNLLNLGGKVPIEVFARENQQLYDFLKIEHVEMRGFERPDGDQWVTNSSREALPNLRTSLSIYYFAQVHNQSILKIQSLYNEFLRLTTFKGSKYDAIRNDEAFFVERVQEQLLSDFLAFLLRKTPNIKYEALKQVQELEKL